jgi:fibronectin type 3 domain-containing protein
MTIFPGTTYYYRVKAYNAYGESIPSNEQNVIITGIPVSLIITTISSSQVDLSWTDTADNESGFKIERSVSTNTNYTLLAVLGMNITSYTDISVTQGNTYYYRVTAYNIYGDSTYSSEVSVTLPPAIPTNLTLTPASSSQINLSWTDVNGETGYEIERSTNGITYALLSTLNADTILYSDTPLTPNTNFYYRIKAYNAGGYSDYSSEINTTTLTGPPGIPNLINISVISRTRLDIIWSNVYGETGYKIERSFNGTNYGQLTTINTDVTSYADTTVTPSNTYYYRVRASNIWGDSDYSNVIAGTTPVAPVPFRPLNADDDPTDSYNDGGGVMSAGYKFKPLVNGTILALGRYIAYTSTGAANITVILWQEIGDGSSGTELGRVTVPANIGWQWANLSTPIPVTAGIYYRVSVICDIDSGSGPGDYWYREFLTYTPVIRETIQIDAGCYDYGTDIFPLWQSNDYMYGWADIEFLEE